MQTKRLCSKKQRSAKLGCSRWMKHGPLLIVYIFFTDISSARLYSHNSILGKNEGKSMVDHLFPGEQTVQKATLHRNQDLLKKGNEQWRIPENVKCCH
jgi:hypothetical protein